MTHTVTVLTGGSSPERDVALAGAAQVVDVLRKQGHRVLVVDTAHGQLSEAQERAILRPEVPRTPPDATTLRRLAEREQSIDLLDLDAIKEADAVFLVMHSGQGEGGDMQELLDGAGITYTGSDPAGSRLAMDKNAAKRRFVQAGIPTPPWIMWEGDPDADWLGLPLIVKPSRAGSTVGLTVVEDLAQLPDAVMEAQAVDDDVVLEGFLPGRELTVGILDDAALTVGEIIPQHAIFDYECKYTPGMTQEIFPATIPPDLAAEIADLSIAAHRALGLRDFSRVDFRLTADGAPQCIEANTLPGLTSTSLLPQSAAASGIEFPALCQSILELALRRSGAGNKVQG